MGSDNRGSTVPVTCDVACVACKHTTLGMDPLVYLCVSHYAYESMTAEI